jgi:hypothetical protein
MVCENCKNQHDGSYGSGRFCSVKCSRGFSTKEKRKEINKAVSKKLKLKHKSKFCYSCNTEIYGRRILCEDCKTFFKYAELFKKLNINDSNIKIANDKALTLLKEEYFENKLSLTDLLEKYKLRLNTVHFFFKKNKINLRTANEAGSLCYENGKLSPQSSGCYKRTWHTTWNNDKVYLRSSYELDYAKELDDYKINYDVEKIRIKYFDTIKQKNRIAIPDFYLLDLNMIVEIKSNYTLNLQNMKDKFKEYKKQGFKVKLIVDHIEMKI